MKIAVYGSLRKGEYNYCFKDGWYVCDVKIPGYNLYNLGPYPAIYKTKEKGSAIFSEVYDVPKNVYLGIYGMEVGAGYVEETIYTKLLNNELEDVKVFVFKNKPDNPIIKSGNWSNR